MGIITNIFLVVVGLAIVSVVYDGGSPEINLDNMQLLVNKIAQTYDIWKA